MSESGNASGGGIGIGTLLFVVFLILKLCDKIDWSWWWVTSPLWIPAALIIVIVFIGCILAAIFS